MPSTSANPLLCLYLPLFLSYIPSLSLTLTPLAFVSLQQLQLLHCVHRRAGLRSTRFRCALLSFRLATVPLRLLYLPWRPHAALQSTCLPSAPSQAALALTMNHGMQIRLSRGAFPGQAPISNCVNVPWSACKFREIKETRTGTGGSAVILSVVAGTTSRYSN